MSEREVAGFDEAELGWIEARFEDEMRVRRSNHGCFGPRPRINRANSRRIVYRYQPVPRKTLRSKAFNSTERYCLTF